MSFLRERSPVTPKITSALGPAMRFRRWSSGSRSGLCPREISTVIRRDLLRCFEERQDFDQRVGQRERHDGAAVIGEHARVARRLRLDELAERERATGDLEVDLGLLEDLQEHAVRGTTLVVLTGRVQEARTPAEGRGATRVGGDELTETLQLGQAQAIDVRLDRDVAV